MALAAAALDDTAHSPPQTFASLVRLHEAALEAVALRLCRSQSDARDLVQDALERGLRSWDRLPPGANVRAWLLSILRNRFVDQCRHNARDKREDDQSAIDSLPAPEEPDELPAWAQITPDELRGAVARLSEEFRTVYQLHALEGRSYNEIALRLGIPKATVGTRLIRARRKLRDLLLARLPAESQAQLGRTQ